MKQTLLVINSNSGNANSVDQDVLIAAFEAGGFQILDRVLLPDDDLPARAAVEAEGFHTVAICAGDGTISSLCTKLAGWDGEILVLPGGTMNLLARRLHGEYALPELLEMLPASSAVASSVPIIKVGETEILTGLTVGPSTRWGKVREGIRQADITSLSATIPEAWSETLGDEGVWLEGATHESYAGIFVEPFDAENINVIAFRANGLGDMVNHGLAWLRHDFREGPRDELGMMHKATVMGDQLDTGILVDGEYEDRALPLTCCAGMSSVRFLRITP
ncbi:diacylglycerol/lipid kinase family protein [Sphingorhabdus sp.]|uniref:diacylglycerol/lipid kinase family protein n=1 Tax=Sphingorhabdus sp. TaxID=1902408 RepID=UPI00391B6CB1